MTYCPDQLLAWAALAGFAGGVLFCGLVWAVIDAFASDEE